MSSLTITPKQSYFSAQLQSPIDSSQTTGIILTDSPDFTPGGITVYFNILDAGRVETISATGWTANELTGVTRAVATYSGETAVGYAHGAGVTVVLSDDWKYFEAIQTAVNSKFDTAGGTITGATAFSGASTTFKIPNLTTAEKNALTPANGMLLYDTTLGEFQYYDGGAWNAVGTASVPNGTDSVAGVWEGATVAEQGTQSATGATGAGLVLQPKNLVKTYSGAGDENKIPILNAYGALDAGLVGASATPGASLVVKSDGTGKIADGWLSTYYGGNGSDGALSVTSGTTTLNASSANIVEKNYTSINIAAGAVLTISNPATSGTVLWLKTTGNCTIDGTINMDSMGGTGGAAKTAEGGTANVDMGGNTGTEGYLVDIDFSDSTHSGNGGGVWSGANIGAAGGSGAGGFNSTASDSSAAGSASGATGGSGIFFTQTSSTIQMRKHLIMFVGSGGGGGAADATSGAGTGGTITSGAGGRGGGAVVIECAGELVFTGTITADGANGTSASNSCTANQCAAGGGGGGGGGTVLIGANTITTNTGTITVTGGSAGNAADYGGGASSAGTAGKAGHSLVYTNKVFY